MTGVAAVLGSGGVDAMGLVGRILAGMRHRGGEPQRQGDAAHALGATSATNDGLIGGGGRWLAADTRLANRDDLSSALDLEAPATDESIILKAYERWGTGCANRLEGDFAFVLWDDDEDAFYCARDAFGIRPLHYARSRRATLFASEARALFADEALTRRPDREAVATFVVDDYPADGRTLFDQVSMFPPAHWARVGTGRFELASFWSPRPFARVDGAASELAGELAATLGEAVAGRIAGARQVGVLTSGGLDSTVVAAESARAGAEPTLLHVAFPGLACDESAECERFADHLALPLLSSDARIAATDGPAVLGHPDLIYDARWAAWQPALLAGQRDGVDRVLTGEGGDLVLRPSGAEVGDALARGALGLAWEHARPRGRLPGLGLLLRAGAKRVLPQGIVERLRRRDAEAADWILTPRYRERVLEARKARRQRQQSASFPDVTTQVMFEGIELNAWHPINVMLDFMGTTTGVELLHPWLDRRVVELLLAIPHEHRHRPTAHEKPKPLLRDLARDRLPPDLADRQGSAEYSSYLVEVLGRHRERIVRDLFADSRLAALGIVQPSALTADMLDKALNRDYNLLIQLSNVVGIELWLRQT